MATLSVLPEAAERADVTAADLVARFGPIPVRRIVSDPPPGEATEQDLIGLHERTKRIFELVDGILVEKTVGIYESWLAGRIGFLMNSYLSKHGLGFTAGEGGMLQLVEGLVRAPDVSFVAWDKVPGGRVPTQPLPRLVPDLAVEVLSRGNTTQEMERKLDEYFEAGVRLVWYVEPRARTVRVYEARDKVTTLAEGDTLGGGDVLPGFSVTVADLFVERSG